MNYGVAACDPRRENCRRRSTGIRCRSYQVRKPPLLLEAAAQLNSLYLGSFSLAGRERAGIPRLRLHREMVTVSTRSPVARS